MLTPSCSPLPDVYPRRCPAAGPPWSHPEARAAFRWAFGLEAPRARVEDVAAGLRVFWRGAGGVRGFVHVGPGVYRYLVGLEQSRAYRGPEAARDCARDLARALERAFTLCRWTEDP